MDCTMALAESSASDCEMYRDLTTGNRETARNCFIPKYLDFCGRDNSK